jgi:phosphoribosylformylglycinamidine cyclo-ligase
MCANDVVCTGAEPLFFLDYVAVEKILPEQVAAIVAGVAEGCRRAGCALLGGETAEHPGVMVAGGFDLAGFCVGIVSEEERLGPHRVAADDVLVGLASSGLHSNGYSLVRKVLLEDAGYALDDVLPRLGRSLGAELLEPTTIYASLVRDLARADLVLSAAHITGGGLVGNVPRSLPEGTRAKIDWGSWPVPPVFDLVREASGAADEDLRAAFNLGIGFVLVVARERADEVVRRAVEAGTPAFAIGRVTLANVSPQA